MLRFFERRYFGDRRSDLEDRQDGVKPTARLVSSYPLKSPPRSKPPLPVISLSASFKTIRRVACGVISGAFTTIPADTSGFAITSSTSSSSFDDVRRPSSFRSIIVFAASTGHALSSRSRRSQKNRELWRAASSQSRSYTRRSRSPVSVEARPGFLACSIATLERAKTASMAA